MEDVVAVRVTLENGRERYVMTWGRIQHPVDPSDLELLVLAFASRQTFGAPAVHAHLCSSLRDAADQPYFFEGLWEFSQTKVPYGRGYARWRKRVDAAMRAGSHIYVLGRVDDPDGSRPTDTQCRAGVFRTSRSLSDAASGATRGWGDANS